MKWIKRHAHSKAKVTVENFEEVKENFLLNVKNVCMDEVPGELIANWAHTGVNYTPASSWPRQSEGAEIVAKMINTRSLW